MGARSVMDQGILALHPFLVNGALSLIVLRAMRNRGIDIHIGYYLPGAGGYTPDRAEDFAVDDRLIDFSDAHGVAGVDMLASVVRERQIGLVLQIGSPWAYPQLPYLKEREPQRRIVDVLYNKVGHTLNHFLFEACLDGVIVESSDMQEFISNNTSKTKPNIYKVESGIDLKTYSPKRSAPDGNSLVVGYFGRMSPEKNPLGFVALAEYLHAAIPELRFVMFGEGEMSQTVRERIEAGPASEVINFGGYVEHPSMALAQLDILVVPSKLDGRPNVIMEANACGIPVIGAPIGGIPELVQHGCNGFLFRPDEFREISRVVSEWVKNIAKYKEHQIACRVIAEKHFDRERMLNDYEAVFRRLLRN
ncbi:hypothetical protein JH26_08530 [Microvirga sp. BSC39]|nr:hypothetical protein JH26_08530 [Microvirga sp. BSC39]